MACMDAKDVGTRLGSIAFDTVMAKAAEDLKKEMEASQKKANLRPAVADEEVDLDDLENDPELEKLHAERLRSLMAESRRKEELKKKGHAEYREITEEEFLPEVRGSQLVLCHFFHTQFPRCKIMDKHLSALAPKHLEAKFLRIDAERCPFFASRLNIKVLPCVILFRDAVAFHRIVGFEAFGNRDSFRSSELEDYLIARAFLERSDVAEEEEQEESSRIRASTLARGMA